MNIVGEANYIIEQLLCYESAMDTIVNTYTALLV